jgi:hypothetical protein
MDYPILHLEGFDALTIEGNGASLAAKGRMVESKASVATTLSTEYVQDLTIRNLTIHWDRWMPHSAGTVIENTEEYFDLELNEPYTAREGLYATAFLRFNEERDGPQEPLYNQHRWGEKQCTVQSENVLRVPKKPQNSDSLQEGWSALVRHANAGGMGIQTWTCSDVTIEGVTLHSVPGMACNAFTGENLTVRDTAVVPRDQDGYWQASARDGFHISDWSGKVLFDGVEVEKIGDDGFNIKVRRYPVTRMPDARTVVIEKPATPGWYEHIAMNAGDTIEVGIEPNPYVANTTATITDFEKGPDDCETGCRAVYTLTLDSDLSQEIQNAEHVSVINDTHTPESVTVRDTRVGKLRGGNRFCLDDTTVENCEIHDTTRHPVMVHLAHVEGEPMQGFTLRNSTITNTGTHPTYDGGRVGAVQPVILGNVPVDMNMRMWAEHTYENNTFEDLPRGRSAIHLQSVSDVTITGNDFSGVTDAPPVLTDSTVDCESLTIDGQTGCPSE